MSEFDVVIGPEPAAVRVVVEPPLSDIVVQTHTEAELAVLVGPVLPDVSVVLEPPLPEVVVQVASVGLVGPAGPPGATGPAGLSGDAADTAALTAHIVDATPHPAYDDLPSLTLLLENGLI